MVRDLSRFSPRERDILAGLVAGKTRKEMAQELGIRPGTVSAQCRLIFARLDVRNKVQAAVAGYWLFEADRGREG